MRQKSKKFTRVIYLLMQRTFFGVKKFFLIKVTWNRPLHIFLTDYFKKYLYLILIIIHFVAVIFSFFEGLNYFLNPFIIFQPIIFLAGHISINHLFKFTVKNHLQNMCTNKNKLNLTNYAILCTRFGSVCTWFHNNCMQ